MVNFFEENKMHPTPQRKSWLRPWWL